MEHENAIENQTPVYFCLHHDFTNVCQFWGIFAALRPSFRGSEVCLEKCDFYRNFGYLKKIKHLYSEIIL